MGEGRDLGDGNLSGYGFAQFAALDIVKRYDSGTMLGVHERVVTSALEQLHLRRPEEAQAWCDEVVSDQMDAWEQAHEVDDAATESTCLAFAAGALAAMTIYNRESEGDAPAGDASDQARPEAPDLGRYVEPDAAALRAFVPLIVDWAAEQRLTEVRWGDKILGDQHGTPAEFGDYAFGEITRIMAHIRKKHWGNPDMWPSSSDDLARDMVRNFVGFNAIEWRVPGLLGSKWRTFGKLSFQARNAYDAKLMAQFMTLTAAKEGQNGDD